MTLSPHAHDHLGVLTARRILNAWLVAGILVLLVLLAWDRVIIGRLTAAQGTYAPVVVAVHPETGQPTVYTTATYTPSTPELRYFLSQFAEKYFSRSRTTIARDFAMALYFLDPALHAQADADLKGFAADPLAPEIGVRVENVTFANARDPYRGTITFAQTTYAGSTRAPLQTVTRVAEVDLIRLTRVPDDFVGVNPLGLRITALSVFDAFTE